MLTTTPSPLPKATPPSPVAEPTTPDTYVADRKRRENDLRTFYEQQAADRSGFPTPIARNQHRDAFFDRVEAVNDVPGSTTMLEIGTGTGPDAKAAHGRGHDVVGIDLAVANLALARPAAAVARASAVELPFATAAFGAVMSFSTLMHISDADVERALAECRRVLRPRGLAAFGTWGGTNVAKVVDGDHYDPPRFFSLRTDAVWRDMVAAHATVIEFTTWQVGDLEDHYQWVIARFD